MSFKLGVKDW